MSKFRILGVAALALLTLARDSTAQRGGAVRTGARGAVVGGLVGGESGAATGAKIGVVTGGPIRWSGGAGAPSTKLLRRTRAAPRLGFNQAPPAVLGDAHRRRLLHRRRLPHRRRPALVQRLSFRRMESPSLGSHSLPIGSRPPEPTMSPALARMDRLMR
jgi:hypothetical protein